MHTCVYVYIYIYMTAGVRQCSYLIVVVSRFQGLDFERTHLRIVVNTSRNHLQISDLSGLSTDMSRIVSRSTASQPVFIPVSVKETFLFKEP